MAADEALAAPALSRAAAAESGIAAANAAMASMESATVETAAAVEAVTIAMAGGHRAGRQTRCKGHGHRAREKSLPHRNLLYPVHRQYQYNWVNQWRWRGTVASKSRRSDKIDKIIVIKRARCNEPLTAPHPDAPRRKA
jgi:hypothetical protein